jgi:hypothetical protein
MTDEHPPEQANNANKGDVGPLEERLLSKNWNMRANAFDELSGVFKDANS